MRVNFEVNTHLVSEICQDNKKRVNIFFYSVYIYCTVVSSPASPLRVSAKVVLCNGLRTGAAARAQGSAPPAIIGQLSVCSLHQIRRRVPVPHYTAL